LRKIVLGSLIACAWLTAATIAAQPAVAQAAAAKSERRISKGSILCETPQGLDDALPTMSEQQLKSIGCAVTRMTWPARITNTSAPKDRIVRLQLMTPDQVLHMWGRRTDLMDVLASPPGAGQGKPLVWEATVKDAIYCLEPKGVKDARPGMDAAALQQINCLSSNGEYLVRLVDGSAPDDPVVQVEIEDPKQSAQLWIKREAASAFKPMPAN